MRYRFVYYQLLQYFLQLVRNHLQQLLTSKSHKCSFLSWLERKIKHQEYLIAQSIIFCTLYKYFDLDLQDVVHHQNCKFSLSQLFDQRNTVYNHQGPSSHSCNHIEISKTNWKPYFGLSWNFLYLSYFDSPASCHCRSSRTNVEGQFITHIRWIHIH